MVFFIQAKAIPDCSDMALCKLMKLVLHPFWQTAALKFLICCFMRGRLERRFLFFKNIGNNLRIFGIPKQLKRAKKRSARNILRIRRILNPRLMTVSDGRIETRSTIAIGESGYLINETKLKL